VLMKVWLIIFSSFTGISFVSAYSGCNKIAKLSLLNKNKGVEDLGPLIYVV